MFEYVVLFILFIGSCYWIIHPLLEQAVRQNGFRPKQEGILKELRHKKILPGGRRLHEGNG
jgi:hypothetical protein